MFTMVKKASLAAALAATALASATPAMAQGYPGGGYDGGRRHGNGDGTAIAVGVGIIGLAIAAAVASSNNDNKRRHHRRHGGYYNRDGHRDGYREGYRGDYRDGAAMTRTTATMTGAAIAMDIAATDRVPAQAGSLGAWPLPSGGAMRFGVAARVNHRFSRAMAYWLATPPSRLGNATGQ